MFLLGVILNVVSILVVMYGLWGTYDHYYPKWLVVECTAMGVWYFVVTLKDGNAHDGIVRGTVRARDGASAYNKARQRGLIR
jgi:hypothetical protein